MDCNKKFLNILKESLIIYWQTSARSNAKLKKLHSFVAADIHKRMNESKCCAYALGMPGKLGRELCLHGKYTDKRVDIALCADNKVIAGFALKYVMSNYSQNSNNYFENMLGETANIRSAGIPYFQILCMSDTLPYFDNKGNITKWERITEHRLSKYLKLSNDDTESNSHAPDNTLLYLVHMTPSIDESIKTKEELKNFCLYNKFSLDVSAAEYDFGPAVIYNDYEKFAVSAVCAIKNNANALP